MRGVEAQTWRNTPPYPSQTMYRATCACGFAGLWFHYRENAENEKKEHEKKEHDV